MDKIKRNNHSKKQMNSVIIVGASLSGLMAALALSKAGLHVTVIEKVGPQPRSGAVLQVDSGQKDSSNIAQYLRKIASGGLRTSEPWSDIQMRLRKEIESHTNIVLYYDTKVLSTDQQDNKVSVLLENNEKIKADLLVGADGHRSVVRNLVAPTNNQAIFAGYLIWIGIVDEIEIPQKHRPYKHAPNFVMPDGIGDFLLGTILRNTSGKLKAGERRLGWAWYDNTQNELLKELGCVRGNLVHHSLRGKDMPIQNLQELEEKAQKRWEQPWLDVIKHSIATREIMGVPVAEYVPTKIVNKRAVLVGNAAHLPNPLTASGFNASLVDVATLAELIEKNKTLDEALKKYENTRLKEGKRIVLSGQNFSRSFGRKK